jgi:hypothetical protein
MTERKSQLALVTRRLTEAVEQETRLARCGALDRLVSAASAKQTAFAAFSDAGGSIATGETLEAADRRAIHELLIAANENAVVLEAVKSTLDDAATRLRTVLGSLADPGIYSRLGQSARHVPAARIDAKA